MLKGCPQRGIGCIYESRSHKLKVIKLLSKRYNEIVLSSLKSRFSDENLPANSKTTGSNANLRFCQDYTVRNFPTAYRNG